jgi:hypothetical protein
MKYGKSSTKSLLLLVSRINEILQKKKNIRVSDLNDLKKCFMEPNKYSIAGYIVLKFSAQKKLLNGRVVKLVETLKFSKSEFFIISIWEEEFNGEIRIKTDDRTLETETKNTLPYQLNYSLNAIYNIINFMNGSFELKTDQFSISRSE